MLLVRISKSAESNQEVFNLSLLWNKSDIESMIRLGSDCVAQVALELKALVVQSIKPSSGWHLAFVLENNLQKRISADSGFLELKNWDSFSVHLVWLLDKNGWKSSFTSELKDKLTALALGISVFNQGFKDSTIGHHCCWIEADSDVFVLVGIDCESVWSYLKGESFTLTLRSWLNIELDCAWNLVGIHYLESLFHALWVLGSH